MQTTAPLQKKVPKAAVAARGKVTSDPLQWKAIGEDHKDLQLKQDRLQLQTSMDEEAGLLQIKKNSMQIVQQMTGIEPLLMKQNPLQRKLCANNSLQLMKSYQNPLQLKQHTDNPLQLQTGEPAVPNSVKNNTALSKNLKAGIKASLGNNMDDVKVHHNSDKPVQLQALAYPQGTGIHLANGQEKELPQEAWHVVQQKQGGEQPIRQMKGGVAVNDDAGLEQEADMMGEKAIQNTINSTLSMRLHKTIEHPVVQQASSSESDFSAYSSDDEDLIEHDLNESEFEEAAKLAPKGLTKEQLYFHIAFGSGKKQSQKKKTDKGLKASWDQKKVSNYISVTGDLDALKNSAATFQPMGKKTAIFIYVFRDGQHYYRWLKEGAYDFDNVGHGSMISSDEENKINKKDKSFKVDFAGQFVTLDGKLISWDNNSGHFSPPDANKNLVTLPADLYESHLTDTIQASRDAILAATLCSLAESLTGANEKIKKLMPIKLYGFITPRWKKDEISDGDFLSFIEQKEPEDVYKNHEFFNYETDEYLPPKDQIAKDPDLYTSVIKNIKISLDTIISNYLKL